MGRRIDRTLGTSPFPEAVSEHEMEAADEFWGELFGQRARPVVRPSRSNGPRRFAASESVVEDAAAIPCTEPAGVLDRFSYDGVNLSAAHQAIVDGVARSIDDSQSGATPIASVCIVGHTDADGNADYNRQLGARRAANVETALRRSLEARRPGLAARLTLKTTSAGEANPVASNATADGKARNRRVELLVGRQAPATQTTARQIDPVTNRPVETEALDEQAPPPPPHVVPIGPDGFSVRSTGSPAPGVFSWSTANASLARVSPTSEPSAHPNDARIFGLRPGRTTLHLRYTTSRGGVASWQRDLVIARSMATRLLEPAGRTCTGPQELVRPIQRVGGVARRSVVVRLEPASFWATKQITWTFTVTGAQRGALPGGVTNLEASPGFDFTPATGGSVLDANGEAAVRVNMPPVSLNRGRLVATPVGHPALAVSVDLEVPGIVVVDAGHGGTANVAGSSSNNATAVTTGTLEKTMALDMALLTRDALLSQDRLVHVFLTRDADFNVPGADRAGVARHRGADVFLSIHFNGDGNPATRGTSTFVRAGVNGNVNLAEDRALANRIQAAVFGAIPGGRDRGVFEDTATAHPTGLAVLSDVNLGNTAALHPIRSALLEVEFITSPAVDAQFNTAADRETLRRNIATAIAGAIVDDLSNQP